MRSLTCGPERVVRWLWVLCILMPLVCVWGAGSLFWILTERSHVISQVAEVWIANSAMVAIPFVGLAYYGSCRALQPQADHFGRSLAAAGVLGAACALLLWGAFYYEGYIYWADHKTSGVPMGSGCLMLLSPAVIGAAMVVGLWLFGASRSRRAE